MNYPVAFLSRLLLAMMCFSFASPLRSADKDKELKRSVEGLSAVITIKGKVEQVRLVQSLEPSLDQASIDRIRTWKISPAKDAAGNPVAIRAPIETTFRLY